MGEAGRARVGGGGGAARRGFTLIELLVVISVIALLVGVLLPSLNKAREQARRTKCLTNLRGIGVGVSLYMDAEGKGRILPKVRPLDDGTGTNPNDPSLLEVMKNYTDAAIPYKDASGDYVASDPWRCPSDRGGIDPTTNFRATWQRLGFSYSYLPGELMVVAELAFVRNPQLGVSAAIEKRNNTFPVLFDADDWHNPRFSTDLSQRGDNSEKTFDRNALYFGDWRADKSVYFTVEQRGELWEDIVQLGGGLGF